MRWLLFLSRVAFICGFFFLICMSPLINKLGDQALASTVIIIGYVLGLIIVPLTILCYLGVTLLRRRITEIVPGWLVVSNLIFLLLLIVCIFYFNDPYYHQK
ncbi:MAG: hypothetical protein H7Y42_04015 [Chitinophagaceae bacterium]|nr:hypothetical protein [Chitinophagaceae bacterium]